ncbi:MFS transporter [Deinococcus sp. RL]|uniref:MFS transporter n=1 Tax=Deinococcus sp. RL TaxID=1489678 RepID=UPI0005596F3F|nr:MFS transporter [Deinococcus sp. RL]
MPAVSAVSAAPLPAPPRTLGTGLLLVVLVVAFEAMAVGTVLPRVASELQGLSLYGWASSAFLLSSLFGAVLGGVLSDRRGLAWGAGFSLAVFAAGLLVGGLAPTMLVFVLGRLIQGLGAGGLGALPFAVVTAHYPEAQRARMLAAVASAWLLPALVGPLVASLIADTWSWRAVFWGLVPLLALIAPLCLWPLRGPAPRVGEGSGGAGLLRPALGLALAAGALVEGLRSPGPLGAGLVGLGGAGVVLTARHLFPAGLLRFAGGLPTALAVRGLAAFALLGANSFLPLALHELRGLSLTAAGWVLSLGGATWTLGSWAQAQAERRWGPGSRPLRVRVGLGLMATGLLASALAVLGGLPLWAVYPSWVLACFGMGVGYNSNSLYALAAAPPGESGRLSGQLANIEVLMVAVAAGVGGALIARLPLERAFALAFAVTLLAAVLGWLAAGRLRRTS